MCKWLCWKICDSIITDLTNSKTWYQNWKQSFIGALLSSDTWTDEFWNLGSNHSSCCQSKLHIHNPKFVVEPWASWNFLILLSIIPLRYAAQLRSFVERNQQKKPQAALSTQIYLQSQEIEISDACHECNKETSTYIIPQPTTLRNVYVGHQSWETDVWICVEFTIEACHGDENTCTLSGIRRSPKTIDSFQRIPLYPVRGRSP